MNIKNNVLFQKKELLSFCIYRLVFGISYSFMIPIIPLFFDSLGICTLVIGTVMSLYGLGKAIAQIPFGVVSDTIGDKLLLMIAVALMTFVPVAYTLAKTQLIASSIYVIQGTILGVAAPATFSILARSLDENKRGECTGLASAVFTLGGGIGAAIGGFIVSKLGNYNLVFYLASAGILLTLIFIFFKITKANIDTKKRVTQKEKISLKERLIKIFQNIREHKLGCKIILLSSIAFLGDFIYGCIGSIFPFYGQEVLGASVGFTCTIISIYLFVFGLFAPVGGYVSDKIGNKKQLFISFIVMNGALFGLSFTRSIIVFTGIIIIYFLGATFLNASLQSVLSEFGENNDIKGIVFGFVGASEALGYAASPIVSAFIYNLNKDWLFLGLLMISAFVMSIYIILYKRSSLE